MKESKTHERAEQSYTSAVCVDALDEKSSKTEPCNTFSGDRVQYITRSIYSHLLIMLMDGN